MTAKTFDTLLTLVRNHGRLVTKDLLLKTVWPDVVVDESNLTYNISVLRKTLGEGRTGQQYVETVPRQGYRFVADVIERDAAQTRPTHGSQVEQFESVVERDEELRALLDAVERADSGEPQARFICGEAGLGKSTLVKLFASHVQSNSGVLFTSGECIEHKGEAEPYMPVLEALGALGRGAHRELLTHALRVHAPTWIAKMPWLPPAESQAQTNVGQSQERMLREIEEAILALSSSITLILVLSDLHWCDYSTVDFVARMTRLVAPARVLLIGTYRPDDAKARSHPIHPLVRDLSFRSPDCVITLRPLTREAVVQYLAGRFDQTIAAAVAPALYTRTEGNPLFIKALLHRWEATGKLRRENGKWHIESPEMPGDLPETLRDFIEQQIGNLAPDLREILEVGSVARPHFWLHVVAAAINRPVESIEHECAVLARAGQLIKTAGSFEYPDGDVGEVYAFSHNLYAEVIYSLLPAGRRVRLHQTVGEFLEQAFAAKPEALAADLARHFREGRDHRRAIRYLEIAARHALRSSAHREAIVYLDDALQMTRRLAETLDRERAELAVQSLRAPALMVTRGFADAEAEASFRRTVELAERTDSDLKFPAAFGLAAMFEVRGEYARSQSVLESYLPERER